MDNHADYENKNHEPIPDLKSLHSGLGSLCLIYGKEEVHPGDNSHSFVIEPCPPLSKEGIETISYMAPLEDADGDRIGNTIHVTFTDDVLRKSVMIRFIDDTYATSVYTDPKYPPQGEFDEPTEDEIALFDEAATLLFAGIYSDDPAIRREQDKLSEYLSLQQDVSASPEDMLRITATYRRLTRWFDA